MAARSLLLALLLSGCAASPAPVVVPLPVPPTPTLPTVSADEADHIQADVWWRIAERDILLRASLSECRAIIEATRSTAP
ncbi:MAG TPA: hypothetical protein PKY50_06090 [Candidatus Competibacter sp.]|nr:hypothetical protein [Candidatus Competibacter sp.]